MEQPDKILEDKKTEDKPIPVTKAQIDSLRECIKNTVATYRSKRDRNKWGAITVQVLVILLSFGTTVLIGWKLDSGTGDVKNGSTKISSLTNLALVISALATGINTLNQFFDYKPLWVGYNISIGDLKALLAKLDYLDSLGSENVRRVQLDEVFNHYEEIYGNMNKNYQNIRSARDE